MRTAKKTKKTGATGIYCIYFWILLGIFLCLPGLHGQDAETIATREVTVNGARLEINPAQQTVPINTGTSVNTVFAVGSAEMPEGMLVKGTLRGPGINGSITLSTLPNHPFAIPGFTTKGTYYLENIRLEKDGKILISAEPGQAVIEAMDIIITKVESRPLTLEEIREKGIVISEQNFSVYNFSVGFIVESNVVTYEFPIVYSGHDVYIPDSGWGDDGLGFGGLERPGPIPVDFEFPDLDIPEGGGEKPSPSKTISGVVLFNNDIAFLNQFFSVMFIVSNHAPQGSPLTLKDLTAKITFPEGLREAETNPPHIMGAPIPVRCPGPDGKIGTSDDIDIILATFSGMAEFLAEGLKEGNHIVKIDFDGTLSGLPSGDTRVSGTASGAVIVRNPEFSITFSHPSVIRTGEEYDIYVTMTNTSPVNANLVSLTMPASQLIGTILLSEETVSFETIASGESATAQFHMQANETGRITASAFEAEGHVKGKFVLTAGVGEKGIPLSPDTLELPTWAYSLPYDLVNAALMLLGEAYSIATTPAGGLPAGLPYITPALVKERAGEFAEAGQRYTYGKDLLNTVELLTLDWLGSRQPDLNFDILRRLTTKGFKLAQQQAIIFNEALKTQTPNDFQKTFTENCSYKPPFFSALLSFAGNERTARLRITDYYLNRLSNEKGLSGSELIRNIPYGELYGMESTGTGPVDFALVGHPDENGYTVEVLGTSTGTFTLSLIVPDSSGDFRQVVFTGISSQPGSISRVTVKATDTAFTLSTDLNGDGQGDEQTVGTVIPVQEPPLQLISAIQECSADPAGHATALFFNRPVDPITAKDKKNYQVTGKEIYAAYLQPSGRVVLIGTNNPISPFVESRVRVENLKDTKGGFLTPSPVEMPIQATIKIPGGIVYGRILTAEGQPIPRAKIQLVEVEYGKVTYSFTVSDSSGSYQFDFVRILSDPFTIEVLDPITGKKEKIKSRLMSHGQRLPIDIIMQGRGSIKGKVLTTDGTPVAKASVTAQAEGTGLTGSIEWEYFRTTANEAGEYFIGEVPIGRAALAASGSGKFGTVGTTLSTAGETQTVDITVMSGRTASVTGRVLLSDAVTPVAQAYVNFFGANNYKSGAKTNDEGFFQFSTVPIGHFSLDAYNPLTGRVGGRVTGELIENQVFNATIILRGTGRVSGKVFSFDGAPQPGVLVFLENTAFYMDTDSNGEFDFPEVPVGDYSLTAYHRTTQARASNSVKVLTEGQQVYTTVVFPNTQKGGISGTIFDVNGSTPLGYITIYAVDGNYIIKGMDRSDSSGNFQVNGLAPDHYLLVAVKSDYAGIANTVVQFPGHLTQCNLQLKGKGKVVINVFAPDGETGIMANVEFSRLVFEMNEGDMVGFTGSNEQYTTDENGHLEIDGVFLGNFSVESRNGFYPRGAFYQGKLTYHGQVATVNLVMRPTGKVTGTVVSYDGTTPVPGARLDFKAASLPEYTRYANNNGEFEFTLVPPGGFQVKAEGVDPLHSSFGLKGLRYGAMGEDGDVVNVTVRLLGQGQVNGTVKNRSEELIPNARVILKNIGFPGETRETTSNENGRFSFDKVWEGKFSVEVYDGVSHTGGRTQGTIPGHSAQVEVEVYLDPSGTVSGRVLNPGGVSEATDVQVILMHSRFGYEPVAYFYVTQPGGFVFEHIPSGSFVLEALQPISGRKGKVSGSLNTQGENVIKDVRLEGRGTVTGTFFDGSRVNPIPNAGIKITSHSMYPFSLSSTTNSEGKFTFQQVGKGTFDLAATDPSTGLQGSATGKVEYDEQEVNIDVYAQGSGSVTGTVTHTNGTTPAPGARISLKQGSKYYSAYADGTGYYRVEFVPVGNFTVYAYEQPGERDYGTAAGKVEFHGQEVVVNISFKGLGSVSGHVYDGSGNPVSNINVKIRSGSETFNTSSSGSPDNLGFYRFDVLRLGPFSLEAVDPVSKLSGTGNGEFTFDGQELTVDLTLASAGSVKGRILNPDGTTPAANAYIKLKGSNFTLYYSTPANGEFQFNSVRLGSFSLEVQGPDNNGKARLSGQIDSDGDEVDFGDIVLDNVRPGVTGFIPANGSSLVPLNSTVTVQFSEPMKAASINTTSIKLTSPRSTTPAAGTIALSPDLQTVVFTPSALLYSFTLYTLAVDDAVEDAAGNTLAAPISNSFTTSDTEPPVVAAVSPVNNATGVATHAVITVTFNEPIDPENFSGSNLVVKKTGVPQNGAIAFNESKIIATFTPAALEANSTYSVTVQGARDFAGNTQTTAYTWSFTTVDTIAPTVQLLPPAQGTGVIEGSTVQVSANIGTATDVFAVHFFLNGELKYTDKTAPYTYQFTAPLISQGSGGTFLVEALAVDLAGNQSNKANLTFTLISDTPPQVTFTGPATTTIYPGGTIACKVSAADDLGLKRITLTATGGTLNYTDTQTISGTQTSFTRNYSIPVPANIQPGTAIVLQAEAEDQRGNAVGAAAVTLQVPQDDQYPVVNITSPGEGDHFGFDDDVIMAAAVTDDVGIKEVRFFLAGQLINSDTQAPYNAVYKVPALDADTPALVLVEAEDLTGKISQKTVNIVLEKLVDTTAPVVKILSPTNGSLVFAGENLKIKVDATDDKGVTQVEIFVDNQSVQVLAQSPYEATYTIPADAAAGSTITIKAVARDVDEKTGEGQAGVQVISGTVIPAGTVIEATNTTYDNQTIIIKSGTVTINGAHTFVNVLVKENGILTHSPATSTKIYALQLTITGKLVIGTDARIGVGGRGYLGGLQEGNNN